MALEDVRGCIKAIKEYGAALERLDLAAPPHPTPHTLLMKKALRLHDAIKDTVTKCEIEATSDIDELESDLGRSLEKRDNIGYNRASYSLDESILDKLEAKLGPLLQPRD